ncbi:MAG: YobI family P-loop NTPase [Lutibacter sp.]
MKKKILPSLKKLINWLQVKYDNYSHLNEDCLIPYNALSPIDNVENNEDYETALSWALKNRKKNDIKNIALTGSYGSGKSSILKTFQKKYKGSDFHFLTISLATFKEELKNKNGNQNLSDGDELNNNTVKLESECPDKKESLLRLIELSILQQIFYHEEDEKIPDSRFKKIKNYKKKTLYITACFLFIFLFSLINIGYPDVLKKLFKINQVNLVFEMIFYFLTLSILIIGGFIVILKSIRILNSIRISKLNIQNAEIEINDKVSKSILNHHIDEILYFFEVRPYNVVIIEDLDRFKETGIFTKLREINLLINNSNKIKKEVVFIYAVRDDMFEDKDRIKFFDFIIPVIPVINSSNSSQKLLDKNKLNNYMLSEDLIENISLFIDDMRLLHNITNEFYLYFKKLNKKNLNPDKLLSILVYKNIFPNDFNLLSNNDGLLFNAINSKQNYIIAYESEIDIKIKEIKENIINIENLNITDLEELRSIYILRLVSQLNNFSSFEINDSNYSPYELVSEDLFEYLISDEIKYENYYAPYSHSASYQVRVNSLPVTFSSIEKEVSSILYNERVRLIDDFNSNKIEVLRGELQELEREKLQVRNFKVSKLLLNGKFDFKIKDENQHKLVSILLRNGYIAEDYLDYISIFYEGSITKQDHYFLLNVKSQEITDFDYKLVKIDKLISKINIICNIPICKTILK